MNRTIRTLALLSLAASTLPTAGARAAPSPGDVTYRAAGGDVYRLAASSGADPQDVSQALDALSPHAADDWLNESPDGRSLLLSTERFGCGGWSCLALVRGDLAGGAAVKLGDGQVVHAQGFSAIGSGGRLIVYPAAGASHKLDLQAIRLGADGAWGPPVDLTASSAYAYNSQPALSADGTRVVFDCGSRPYGAAGTAICETDTSGEGTVRKIVVARSPRNALHHPDFAPDGAIVFEAATPVEQIWRLPLHAHVPVRVSRVTNDNSPCVLPDGRVVSLYLGRPGGGGRHELRVTRPNGIATTLPTDRDIADLGIGCGA
ncbi:MAG TPA: hypothetical protein VGF23_09570 [Gaiellaceae bacterium]|jgi:hypothetical protein